MTRTSRYQGQLPIAIRHLCSYGNNVFKILLRHICPWAILPSTYIKAVSKSTLTGDFQLVRDVKA